MGCVTTDEFFLQDLGFWCRLGFWLFFGKFWVFVALQVFLRILLPFTDDINLYGVEKPVSMHPVIFICYYFTKFRIFCCEY